MATTGQTGDGGRRAERDSEPASPARLVLSFTQHHPQRWATTCAGLAIHFPPRLKVRQLRTDLPPRFRLAKPQSANLFGGRAARPVAGSGCSKLLKLQL